MMQMVHERTAQMSQHKPEHGLQHSLGGFRHGGKSNPKADSEIEIFEVNRGIAHNGLRRVRHHRNPPHHCTAIV
jgi:hypothetical protein